VTATSIFIGGTSSNAGKSWMATAICAWLRRRGVRVAPFKAQTMSNHSYPCREGGEIGRAQVAQAQACGLDPEPCMNPILLKPNADGTSQVIVHGRLWRTLSPREYYSDVDRLFGEVLSAYEQLARRFDVIVIEGAGSVSEVNLRPFDVVNLPLVTRLGVPWVLVADIERGGVFASVVGSHALLTPDERALFRGFLINKFRGDLSLFHEGRTQLEALVRARCLGVFPYEEHLRLDAEDSLALEIRARTPAPPGAAVAILHFPCLSNGTDFRLLTWADWIVDPPDQDYDVVILPGSKDTLADLAWMRTRSLDEWVGRQHRRGARILGICGGYQMLGRRIADPDRMESVGGSVPGLGLLPVETVLGREKTTCVRSATTAGGTTFDAYEIHLGQTVALEPVTPFAFVDGRAEGARVERVAGTYLHGALEDAAVSAELLGIEWPAAPPSKMAVYDALADWFDRHAVEPTSWLRTT
jgi:adenosylcobyric acid synthase